VKNIHYVEYPWNWLSKYWSS